MASTYTSLEQTSLNILEGMLKKQPGIDGADARLAAHSLTIVAKNKAETTRINRLALDTQKFEKGVSNQGKP